MNSQGKVRKIVTLKNQGDLELIKKAINDAGGNIIKELPLVQGLVVEYPEGVEVTIAARDQEDSVKVEDDLDFKLCSLSSFFFFPKPFFPFQPLMPSQPKPYPGYNPWGPYPQESQIDWGLKRIGAPQAWDKLKDKRVRVGIIDTGIDYNHPDLQSSIRDGICTLDGQSSYLDDYGHGSHVAGTIGANSSRAGMRGINPYTDFYVVKAFDRRGNAKLSDIIEGLDWLIRRQVSIINMSFSTSNTNNTLSKAIMAAHNHGIVLVAAAGNDGNSSPVDYPARFDEVIAVSAINKKDELANFSCTGPEIDFCAPGVDIGSTWIDGGYAVKSGTSFAAPHVVGTIADILNYHGPMTPDQVRYIMAEKAVTINSLTKEQQGAGLTEIPRLIS